ncbi:hypothetical protein DSC_04310 [Pseudoxanthomonas spadix BD-a59]|jgi:hypothetical protein|uniref:Uncharacterized protein n=1 Tax=Pseudoxanthomonas spadix (strain BD-a59) TaxID=1045855 RepID=G7UP95_PSEUP|nr:hypothetical protein [Pseudoxanthomonas spadix]AER55515.1 hypothetical protein DSC_04310 [Pseudoxanthomonas spadix BD-a59]
MKPSPRYLLTISLLNLTSFAPMARAAAPAADMRVLARLPQGGPGGWD